MHDFHWKTDSQADSLILHILSVYNFFISLPMFNSFLPNAGEMVAYKTYTLQHNTT